MPTSSYTGKIHRGPSTTVAIFHNASQDHEFGMDEKDLADYISVSEGETKEMYRGVLAELQSYKQQHGIEIDYPNFL